MLEEKSDSNRAFSGHRFDGAERPSLSSSLGVTNEHSLATGDEAYRSYSREISSVVLVFDLCELLTWIVSPASAATCFSALWWTPECLRSYSKRQPQLWTSEHGLKFRE